MNSETRLNRIKRVLVGLGLAIAATAGLTAVDAVKRGRIAPLTEATAQEAATPRELSRAFRQAAHRAMPAVVHVEVETVRHAAVQVPEPFRGSPWEEFFRPAEPRAETRRAWGSGFVFSDQGHILTNNHVIEGADQVRVVLQDGRQLAAEILGRDPNTDIAVLKVAAEDLPVLVLGDSDGIDVGDWVMALGYPLNLGATATAGIISAKGRSLNLLRSNPEASAPLEHFLQTDAAINGGNSGGPLVGLDGRVIGMNTAIASPTGYFSGYGFAVPINLVRRVADDLIRHGEVRRPLLGVAIDDVDPVSAQVYGLDRPRGAEIKEVQPGTPADRSGLRLGDVILAVNDHPVATAGDLTERLARLDPGDVARLDVIRYGESLRIDVTLDAFEPAVRATRSAAAPAREEPQRLGFRASAISPALARRFGIEAGDGVVVESVRAGSDAARAG